MGDMSIAMLAQLHCLRDLALVVVRFPEDLHTEDLFGSL